MLPSLPLDTEVVPAAAIQGRKRLSGAFTINLNRIRPDPNQPRRSLETDAQVQLTQSILQIGVLQPITVRYIEGQDVYQIISGERRYHACLAAERTEIPCWVQNPKAEQVLLHQIVENWQRSDLQPLELAQALMVLRDSNGYTQKQLAQLTGKPESEISRLLSLLRIDPQVQHEAQATEKGTFTKRHLTAIARLDHDQQQQVAQAVNDQNLTAVDTERMVQELRARNTGMKTRGAPFGQRLRYRTASALVTVSFRRRNVTAEEILNVLDEVREQVTNRPESASA